MEKITFKAYARWAGKYDICLVLRASEQPMLDTADGEYWFLFDTNMTDYNKACWMLYNYAERRNKREPEFCYLGWNEANEVAKGRYSKC